MVSENILITSQLGIHLRPAGAMCNEAVSISLIYLLSMVRVRQLMQKVLFQYLHQVSNVVKR